MIKIAICDDIPEITLWMKETLQNHTFKEKIEIDTFLSGQKLYENAIKKKYDLIFMDIELEPEVENGLLGMEISNKIKNLYPEVLVIFFTGKFIYKEKLLNFEPFRFLQKPIDEMDLVVCVEAAILRIASWKEKRFSFKTNGIQHHIDLKKIISFSSVSPYIEMELQHEKISFRGKIDDVENEVNKLSDDFLRPSKSYLVNKSFIKEYSSKKVTMENGEEISITRKYAKSFFESLKK